MNQDQLTSLLRQLLAAGGPVAALLVNWGVPSGNVNNILTILLAVLPPLAALVWGYLKHTDHATIAAAAAVPGVQSITVAPDATDGAKAAAANPDLKNVSVSK